MKDFIDTYLDNVYVAYGVYPSGELTWTYGYSPEAAETLLKESMGNIKLIQTVKYTAVKP